jgi:hypothetical protein
MKIEVCREMVAKDYVCKFIHLAVCLMTGPKPVPKRAIHIVRSRAFSFRCEYSYLSLRSTSGFLHLLPRLPVTSIPPFIFPSIKEKLPHYYFSWVVYFQQQRHMRDASSGDKTTTSLDIDEIK